MNNKYQCRVQTTGCQHNSNLTQQTGALQMKRSWAQQLLILVHIACHGGR